MLNLFSGIPLCLYDSNYEEDFEWVYEAG